MSTKINVRSPFFLSLTEPVQTFGVFTCTTAGLTNFGVQSSGLINNPNINKGTILDQSAYSFPANNGTTVIPRSVIYTIVIPANYTNSSDYTIDCEQTFNQPFQSTTASCPTVNSQPSNLVDITPSAAQVIDVDTLFTQGTESIASYEVIRISGSGTISAVISGTGTNVICTMKSDNTCVEGQFRFKAINTSGSCFVLTDAFSFNTSGCTAFDCTVPNINASEGGIDQDGTVHKSPYLQGLSLNSLLYGSTNITTSLNVGANNTGSDRDIILTYRFNIPTGYTNSGTFDCDVTYSQPAVASLPTFGCGDAQIEVPFVSDQGSISNPIAAVKVGTYVSHTPAGFNTVATDTPRTISFTITPPATGWTNSGGSAIGPCDVFPTQPALTPTVGTTTLWISRSFNSLASICVEYSSGVNPATFIEARTTATSFSSIPSDIGQIITAAGSLVRGGNLFYIFTTTPRVIEATTIFQVMQIQENGTVSNVTDYICTYGGGLI